MASGLSGTGSGKAGRLSPAYLTAAGLLVAMAGLLVGTAGLLVAAAACGGAAPGTARSTDRGPVAHAGGALTVLSASFASASVGWLLATPCADQVQTCRTIVMRKTVDGGRTWSGAHAPGAPPADQFQGVPPANAVGTILFTSARFGWAFGPALWQTRDGGLTWQKMRGPGGPVLDLGVAGDRVIAVTGRCGDGGLDCTFRVYAATDGSDGWRAVPGATATGFRSAQLVVSGDVAYMFTIAHDLGRPLLLAGPVNGSAPWRSRPDPCPDAWSGALAAAPGGWLILGCGFEPGAGTQIKTAYLSDDGARSWRKLASPPIGGYLGGASMSPKGTIFLSGERMDVYISWDRGRSWHESPSLQNAAGIAGAGFPLTGLAVTDTVGFAFQEGTAQEGTQAPQVWLSRDGGRHWTPVTVR